MDYQAIFSEIGKILISGLAGVGITIWYQVWKEKRNEKMSLFLTLVSYRGRPIHIHFVNALNRIDIVFHNDKKVIEAWRKYYDQLQQRDLTNAEDVWRISRIELISAMADVLGYKKLRQTDIDKNYNPQGHATYEDKEWQLRELQIEYYKTGVPAMQATVDFYETLKEAKSSTNNP